MSITRILLAIAILAAPELTLGQESDGPNEDQLKLLLSGVDAWNEWRKVNPDVRINLAGAKLSAPFLRGADLSDEQLGGADLAGAILHRLDFSGADLSGADLSGADLSGAILHRVDLSGADLSDADLSIANLHLADLAGAILPRVDLSDAQVAEADLSGARLFEADLAGARLIEADLSFANLGHVDLSGATLYRANLWGAKLVEADLQKANLSGAILKEAVFTNANLEYADLSSADLAQTNLTGVNLKFAALSDVLFAPKSIPHARAMVGATGLRTLRVIAKETPDGTLAYDIGAIVELRESAKQTGLISMERDLTCAIERIRNGNPGRPWYARLIYYVAFDWTSEYGAQPTRPFFLMLLSALGFGIIYALLLKFCSTSQLRVDFLPNHEGDEMSALLYPSKFTVKTRHKGKLAALVKYSRLPRIALYFSLQSAFNIGYREFNIGSWLGRLQRRQYTMRARGPLRAVSGLQSLLGVYLLALWILCTFGRPFG